MNDDDELCPCGSEKPYEACCKKAYDEANNARDRLKQALNDPNKAQELKDLLKQMQKNK